MPSAHHVLEGYVAHPLCVCVACACMEVPQANADAEPDSPQQSDPTSPIKGACVSVTVEPSASPVPYAPLAPVGEAER